MKPTDLPAKLAARIRIDPETGCWLWQGHVAQHGYGMVRYPPDAPRYWRAHRLTYSLLVGEIPDGIVLDHLCHVLVCVNPAHLEPVTHAENARRVGGNPNKDRCRKGHPWIPANIYVTPRGMQQCKTCKRDSARRMVTAGERRKSRPGTGQTSLGL